MDLSIMHDNRFYRIICSFFLSLYFCSKCYLFCRRIPYSVRYNLFHLVNQASILTFRGKKFIRKKTIELYYYAIGLIFCNISHSCDRKLFECITFCVFWCLIRRQSVSVLWRLDFFLTRQMLLRRLHCLDFLYHLNLSFTVYSKTITQFIKMPAITQMSDFLIRPIEIINANIFKENFPIDRNNIFLPQTILIETT